MIRPGVSRGPRGPYQTGPLLASSLYCIHARRPPPSSSHRNTLKPKLSHLQISRGEGKCGHTGLSFIHSHPGDRESTYGTGSSLWCSTSNVTDKTQALCSEKHEGNRSGSWERRQVEDLRCPLGNTPLTAAGRATAGLDLGRGHSLGEQLVQLVVASLQSQAHRRRPFLVVDAESSAATRLL